MEIRKLIVATACGLTMCAGQAIAAPLTFSKMSNFRYELTDLTPDDGVAASIELLAPFFNLADNSYRTINGPLILQDFAADMGPQHRTTVTAGGWAIADANGYELSTQVEALSDEINSQAGFAQGFVLGANTRVTFSVDWQAQNVNDWPVLGSVGSQLFVDSGLADGFSIVAKEVSFEFPGIFDDQLSLTFESGEEARTGTVSGGVMSTVMNFTPYDPAFAVPEPGSAALLLIGAVGAATVRRRRRAIQGS